MEYSQNKINQNVSEIDFELDLTSDKEIYYIDKKYKKYKKTNNLTQNQIDKSDINFVIKLIEFGFFLSGFVFVYVILKLNNKYKKIKYKKNTSLKDLYNKKIYKKKKNINIK